MIHPLIIFGSSCRGSWTLSSVAVTLGISATDQSSTVGGGDTVAAVVEVGLDDVVLTAVLLPVRFTLEPLRVHEERIE